MATIKSFTSLEQSKKLAEFLPLESADFMWEYKPDKETYWDKPTMIPIDSYIFVNDIPCWSLAALLNVLPNNEYIITTVSRGSWQIEPINYLPNTWWCEYEDNESLTELNVSADNPVDACVEMIEKLHELKML